MADMPSIGYQRQHVYLNQLDGLKHLKTTMFLEGIFSGRNFHNFDLQPELPGAKKQVKGIDSNSGVSQEQVDLSCIFEFIIQAILTEL